MREKLKERAGQRALFRATFERFGKKQAYRGPDKTTALLKDITDAKGEALCDHVWFVVGVRLDALDLQPGDRIEFFARITKYVKGYRGRREDIDLPAPSTDYRLSFPTKARKLPAEPLADNSLLKHEDTANDRR